MSLSKSSSPALSRSQSVSDDDDYSAESASSTFDDALVLSSTRRSRRNSVTNKRREASKRSKQSRKQQRDKHGNSRHGAMKNESESNKMDIMFDECHWYDIPCPHPECYEKGVRFDNHDKFKLHHEQFHCPRGENGDIDRAKDSLRWQCPVVTTRVIDGEQYKIKCNKISNSWYNYAGHITSHKEIGHGWGCALPPEGKRKKTNCVHPKFKHVVCGKRTSTKHHLLAHMSNVHKTYNVIDANGRQYNKKRNSNRKKSTVSGSKRRSMHDDEDDDDDDDDNARSQDAQSNHSVNTNNSSLLQMRLPDFPKISTPTNSSNTNNSNVASTVSSSSAFLPLLPQIPHNLFANTLSLNHLLPFSHGSINTFGEPPRIKKMRPNFPPLPVTQHGEHGEPNRLIPSSQGKQCSNLDEKEQFEFLNLLCVAAKIHKECIRCTPREDNDKLVMMKPESDENHAAHRDEDTRTEGSLPSLPSLTAVNSNHSMPSFHSTSTDTLSENTNNADNNESRHDVPKFPQIQSIFPNLLSNPFSFDLTQLCAASRNPTTTASTASNNESALQNGVISTAIPQLKIPAIPSSLSSFAQTLK